MKTVLQCQLLMMLQLSYHTIRAHMLILPPENWLKGMKNLYCSCYM